MSIGLFVNELGSVIYSPYYKKFMAFSLGICSSGIAEFRVADRPQGPWSSSVKYDMKRVGGSKDSYAGEFHDALQWDNVFAISFLTPNTTNIFNGQIRIYNVTFEPL
jgi:hypothetical protein